MNEPDPWHVVHMNVARAVARRSKDPSTKVGAVVVAANQESLGYGFNGPPRGFYDASMDWSRPAKYDFLIHAEENAWLFALAHGRSLSGCTLYTTSYICSRCALRASHLGIRCVVESILNRSTLVDEADHGLALRILSAMGVSLYQLGEQDQLLGPVAP